MLDFTGVLYLFVKITVYRTLKKDLFKSEIF
jgi:hypothetical protein